jgi:type II secretion system protein N
MKGKKVLQSICFVLFGIFLFLLFLYLTFPFETLKQRIIWELEAKTPFQYEIEDLHPHLLSGLAFKNVVISAAVDSKKLRVLTIERCRITLLPIPLVWGKVSLSLWGKVLDGTLEGDFFKKGGRGELTLSGRDVNLQRVHVLREITDVEVGGMLQGRAKVAMKKGNIPEQSGSAEFVIDEAVLRKLPLPGIAPLRAGRIQGSVDLKLGRIVIKRLTFSGGDLNGQVVGNILLNSPVSESRINLRITIKPSSEFDSKYRLFLSLLGQEEKTMGLYTFSLRGTVRRPLLMGK